MIRNKEGANDASLGCSRPKDWSVQEHGVSMRQHVEDLKITIALNHAVVACDYTNLGNKFLKGNERPA